MKREVETDNTRIMKKKLKALSSVKKVKAKKELGTPSTVSFTTKSKITETDFETWFLKNKPSLSADYVEYVYETKRSNNSVLFFKAWAKTFYAKNSGQTNLENFLFKNKMAI
jgi:hypothetical protein